VRKSAGLIVLIVGLSVATVLWEQRGGGASTFLSFGNMKNLLTWIGLFGILSLAQSLVIITGGIDLSIGSVVGLIGITTGLLLNKGDGWPVGVVLPLVMVLAALIGLLHGLLVTRLRLQPFVVTLCGLFVYRGVARLIAGDKTQGFGTGYEGLRWFGRGSLLDLFPGLAPEGQELSLLANILDMVPAALLVMIALALALTAFLHFSAPGRHLFALGANEEAARFSGVQTNRLKTLAYVLCSLIGGFGGLLLAFKINSMGPSDFGGTYELYAIAGAVLGGCSLRGGSGNVLGVVLGLALIRLLNNLVNILQIPSQWEYIVIGLAILIGLALDELFTRRQVRRATA